MIPNHRQDEPHDGQQDAEDPRSLASMLLAVLRMMVVIMLIWTMRNISVAWESHRARAEFLHSAAFARHITALSQTADVAEE